MLSLEPYMTFSHLGLVWGPQVLPSSLYLGSFCAPEEGGGSTSTSSPPSSMSQGIWGGRVSVTRLLGLVGVEGTERGEEVMGEVQNDISTLPPDLPSPH